MPTRPNIQLQTQLHPSFQPSHTDVICGKGKACYTHPGNQTFRMLVEINLPRYTSSSRMEKSRVVIEITQIIRSNATNGGGFVKMDQATGLWVEVGDVAAREKVAQTIRELALKSDPKKEAQKQLKRATSRARRLASRKEAGFDAVPESCTEGTTEATSSNISSSEEVGSMVPQPPALIHQSSIDWFGDSDLSDNSVADHLDDTFFDEHAFSSKPSLPSLRSEVSMAAAPTSLPYLPLRVVSTGPLIPSSLNTEVATTAPTPLPYQPLRMVSTCPLLSSSLMTEVKTTAPATLVYPPLRMVSTCPPLPSSLMTEVKTTAPAPLVHPPLPESLSSSLAPPSLTYQSSREWFLASDQVNAEPIVGIDDFFDDFADTSTPSLPRSVSIC